MSAKPSEIATELKSLQESLSQMSLPASSSSNPEPTSASAAGLPQSGPSIKSDSDKSAKDESQDFTAVKTYLEELIREGKSKVGVSTDKGVKLFAMLRKLYTEKGIVDMYLALGKEFNKKDSTLFLNNEEEAIHWFKEAAKKGSEIAQYQLGLIYVSRPGKENQRVAFSWFKSASERGYAKAQHKVAQMLQAGLGVSKDPEAAIQNLIHASAKGDSFAEQDLSQRFSMNGKAPKLIERFRADKLAADAGDMDAKFRTSAALFMGSGVAIDKKAAMKYAKEAAEMGHRDAQHFLAGILEPIDVKASMNYYRKAAEQGHPVAQFKLGTALLMGKGCKKDTQEAMKWMKLSAEQEDPGGLYNYGCLLMATRGEYDPENQAKVFECWKKAAYKGHAIAQYEIGRFAEMNAIGLEKGSAVDWYKKSAAQGNREAIERLQELDSSGHSPAKKAAGAKKR